MTVNFEMYTVQLFDDIDDSYVPVNHFNAIWSTLTCIAFSIIKLIRCYIFADYLAGLILFFFSFFLLHLCLYFNYFRSFVSVFFLLLN
jgi:hypothetical protein